MFVGNDSLSMKGKIQLKKVNNVDETYNIVALNLDDRFSSYLLIAGGCHATNGPPYRRSPRTTYVAIGSPPGLATCVTTSHPPRTTCIVESGPPQT